MKITFFLFVFSFFLLMGFIASLRGWQVLQPYGNLRFLYVGSHIVLLSLFIFGMISQGNLSPQIGSFISFIGFSYFLILVYLLLSFFLVDIIRLLNLLFHFLAPDGMKSFRWWAFVSTLPMILIAMIYGNYKFNHPVIVKHNINIEKTNQNKSIKVLAVSDIHLGVSIDKKMLKKYVDLINLQQPDIILMAGDISDNVTKPLIDQKMNEELSQLKAPMGVYAISGNHEYYAENPFSTEEFLKKSGIKVLRDASVLIDSSFYVVGRDDKTNTKRKKLSQLVKDLDNTKPIIMLDHQPFLLNEASENNIDLQISGHTHGGQFFPINFVVKGMYELAHGYMKKGNTHYYVSSGLGLWGPQYRIGTQSEIVVMQLNF